MSMLATNNRTSTIDLRMFATDHRRFVVDRRRCATGVAKVGCDCRHSTSSPDECRTCGMTVAHSRRHATKVLATVEGNDCRQKTYVFLAFYVPLLRHLIFVQTEPHRSRDF